MANRRRDDLREKIINLKEKHPELTLRQIAKRVGLKDRQWVYYYLKHNDKT